MRPFIIFICLALAVILAIPSDRVRVPYLESDDDDGGTPASLPAGKATFFSDTGADEDPEPLWGAVDCDLDDDPPEASGVIQVDQGGDPADQGDGRPQGDDAFRIVQVNDGDDFFGERCELGENDVKGPTALYGDGDRLLTYASFRLPPTFPVDTSDWQGVLQMKQVQPADNADGTPVLSLGAYEGRWILFHSGPGYTEEDVELWSIPAQSGVWARFEFDVTYSADPAKGRVTVRADADGDGSFDGQGETSPTFETNTLKAETEGSGDDGRDAGEPLPSHLRVGLYHNPVIPCPGGCHLDVDNVQVLRP